MAATDDSRPSQSLPKRGSAWAGGTRLLPPALVFVLAVFVVVNAALWWLYRRFPGELDLQLRRRRTALPVTAGGALDGRRVVGGAP